MVMVLRIQYKDQYGHKYKRSTHRYAHPYYNMDIEKEKGAQK